ncbi:hypothetical protein FHR81_003532 [Actinoalloteichus hoggarensis]|uniref:Uncharacterized protein n=1 Tax=Actinoalloteichus hoggarensis TaxID=1470176 RepID=A0A221W854_9PSEU|nr:hypothetical protein AHOG_21335 [Actinoalloteichus hoggarensis]MBB5922480.1 hypothetical protein [Actinoalloteichus hoggarensis]
MGTVSSSRRSPPRGGTMTHGPRSPGWSRHFGGTRCMISFACFPVCRRCTRARSTPPSGDLGTARRRPASGGPADRVRTGHLPDDSSSTRARLDCGPSGSSARGGSNWSSGFRSACSTGRPMRPGRSRCCRAIGSSWSAEASTTRPTAPVVYGETSSTRVVRSSGGLPAGEAVRAVRSALAVFREHTDLDDGGGESGLVRVGSGQGRPRRCGGLPSAEGTRRLRASTRRSVSATGERGPGPDRRTEAIADS